MILYIMLVALGFLIATLLALLVAPAFWRRAERLTTRRIEQTMPMSIAEAEADRDQLRAGYAIIIRRLEAALSQEKMRSARQLVKISRLEMAIADLNDQTAQLRNQLTAERNAASVLRRTIATRVPELNNAAQNAKQLVHVREREINSIVNRLRHREEALAIAQRTTEMQQAEISRLRQAMEMSGAQNAGRFKLRPTQWTIHDYRAEYDRLNVELSKLRERLSVAYDRETNQITHLRTELQQLADQIVTSANALPEREQQRAIASQSEDWADTDERPGAAKPDEAGAAMRSIDSILAGKYDGSPPALSNAMDSASQTEQQPARRASLSRAALAPTRLARGAIAKVTALGGSERGSAPAPAQSAPTAGDVPTASRISAAELLGGPAATEPKHKKPTSPVETATEAPDNAPRPADEQAPAEQPSASARAGAEAKAYEGKPDTADTAAKAQAPAPEAQTETPQTPETTDGAATASEDDGSLYDRLRTAEPKSGKLMTATARSGNSEKSPQDDESAPDAETDPDAARTVSQQDHESPNDRAADDTDAEAADPTTSAPSLVDRLKHARESETR